MRKIVERKKQKCPHCGKIVAYFRYEDLRPWYSKHSCPKLADLSEDNKKLQKKLFG